MLHGSHAKAGRRADAMRWTDAALRERVKELTCLYGIAVIAQQPDTPLEEILQSIVELLPPAWQYPEIASAKLTLDGCSYVTPGFRECLPKQSAPIVINGKPRGVVEVGYAETKPDFHEGPFLKEERNLINTVARQVALIIERKRANEDRSRLQHQLMHADRLATVGQLAAGVAHELNEPLGNILGFAQLAKKCPGLPEQADHDMGKIIALSLYAREIIRKLLLFARQVPASEGLTSLNHVVESGLHFVKARCARAGIELECVLSPDLPEIVADSAQLNQVLVNLVVNAIQAMPNGGSLKVETRASEGGVLMIVADTGVGMSEDVLTQVFTPFFTTKDVGQGTGLGLPVAHGIVTAHGGTIRVESAVGHGTRFEVRLPIKGPANERERQ